MIASIALFALGAITAALALSLPLGTLRMPGSGAFPLVLGLMLMALAAVQGWSQHEDRKKPDATPEIIGGATPRVVRFMATVVATTALLPFVGYFAFGFLLMLGLLRVLGVRWTNAAVIALICAVAARVIFVSWLHIPLPEGMFGF